MNDAPIAAQPGNWPAFVRVIDDVTRSFAAARGLERQVSSDDQPVWYLWKDDQWQGFTRSRLVQLSLNNYKTAAPVVTVTPIARLLNSQKHVVRDLTESPASEAIELEVKARNSELRERIWPKIEAAWHALAMLVEGHYSADEVPVSFTSGPAAAPSPA